MAALCLLLPSTLSAQAAAPITITPQNLSPERRDSGYRVEIPEAGALTPPTGANEGNSGSSGGSGTMPEGAGKTGPANATRTNAGAAGQLRASGQAALSGGGAC